MINNRSILKTATALLGMFLAVTVVSCSREHVAQANTKDDPKAPAATQADRGAKQLAVLADLIGHQSKLNVCRFYRIEFMHLSDEQPSCNASRNMWSRQLQLLADSNYISSVASAYDFNPSLGQFLPWCPTSKAKSALGDEILQERIHPAVEAPKGNYAWKLILGCRHFTQIDASTPLADGLKVDFSWRWKPTDLGFRDGLTDERQRGEAYLRRTQDGWAMDQIYFK
jgi:hypothetical protein